MNTNLIDEWNQTSPPKRRWSQEKGRNKRRKRSRCQFWIDWKQIPTADRDCKVLWAALLISLLVPLIDASSISKETKFMNKAFCYGDVFWNFLSHFLCQYRVQWNILNFPKFNCLTPFLQSITVFITRSGPPKKPEFYKSAVLQTPRSKQDTMT